MAVQAIRDAAQRKASVRIQQTDSLASFKISIVT